MKKSIAMLLALVLMLSMTSALAEITTVDAATARSVLRAPAAENPVEDGVSPTTGLTLAELDAPDGFAGLAVTGRYMPMLIQIDNFEGGLDNRAPWDASYADIIYETPLYQSGETRLSMLFSDLIPEYVGPARSARVNHVWIREEWDAAFCFWGGQKYEGTSIEEQFRVLGARDKGILFDGTAGGKAWNPYCGHTEKLANPHDAYYMLAALSTQVVPASHTAPNHAYRFTDLAPAGGDEAEVIYVKWGNPPYNSILEYDTEEQVYYRYMSADDVATENELYTEIAPVPSKNDPIVHKEAITFSNVIVQFMNCEYPRTDAPLPTVTGSGNADYFMGGQHFQGVWGRDTLQDRTVFYDMNGQEIELQRGHTLIIMMDYQSRGRGISYE